MRRKRTVSPAPGAAIYLRVSSRGQEDNYSLTTQEAGIRAEALAAGVVVNEAHVYREVHTGTELFERPALSALRADMAAGAFDTLIVHSVDRLSRNPVHLGVILLEADQAGVAVRFATETLDDSPEGHLLQHVRGYAAAIEHEKLRERTTRGKLARIDSGKPLAGPRPLFGYVWRDEEKSGYAECPVTSTVVRRVFRDYVAGQSLRQLAASLQADGIRTPTGRTVWNPTSLREMLKHPAYTGRAFARAWVAEEGVARRMDLERATALPAGTIPAIVDEATWSRAQERMERNQHGAGCTSRIPEGTVLLRGLATCATCGGTLRLRKYHYTRKDAPAGAEPEYAYRGSTQHPDGSYCNGAHIRAAVLDAGAWNLCQAILTYPDWLAAQVEAALTDDAVERDLSAVDAALKDVGKRRANLAATAELIEDEEERLLMVGRLKELGERHKVLTAEREGILSRNADVEATRAMLTRLREWGPAMVARGAESWEVRSRLVEYLGIRAVVAPGRGNYGYSSHFTPDVWATDELSQVMVSTPTSHHFQHTTPAVSLSVSSTQLSALFL